MNKIILFLSFILFLHSCISSDDRNSAEENNITISIKTDTLYDTLQHDIITYYRSGMKLDSFQLINGKKYKDKFEYYKENGKIKLRATFYHDFIRDVSHFRKSGTIDLYKCFDYSEVARFQIQYDSTGLITHTKGNPITDWSYSISEDTIYIKILIAKPPNLKSVCEVYEFDENKNIAINLFDTEVMPSEFNEIAYKLEFEKNKVLFHYVKIRDTIRDLTIKDSLYLIIEGEDKVRSFFNNVEFVDYRSNIPQ